MNKQGIKNAISFLCIKNEKERLCHVQYVYKIALDLQKRYGGDIDVIALSAILHDVGRGRELGSESHEIAGGRIVSAYLESFEGLDASQKEIIRKCVLGHGSTTKSRTVEEKIITTADSASKLLYHNMFMLMCRKEDYLKRAEWGYKYVEKGYKKIMFDDFKEELTELYFSLKTGYISVIG